MLHRRRVIAGAAVAVAALGITTLPATAGAQEAPQAKASVPMSAGMLKAMERDLGLTATQAQARVANEARAAQVAPALQKDLGTAFGGAWVTGATAELVVATTDRGQAAAIEKAGATAKVVEHSVRDLESVRAKLDRAVKGSAKNSAAFWYVDTKTNSVVVHTTQPAKARQLIAASGADADTVRVVKTAEQPKPMYDLVGGQAYYINGSGRCSVGFPVRRGSTPGFATAGHCGRAGSSTQGYNRVSQGTFQASIFPGRDMAWVAVNSNWTPTSRVQGSSYRVAGSRQAPVGSSICRSGSTTGWHCGYIQQHNTSVSYPQGTISGVTRTSVCAEPGDSGGSYISGSQAQGVTSGGSGNCRTGGTTFHQPINPILSAYGLTLVTG
ncbi:S1 family peptidase [Streptomyces sp. TRM 70351]|uniref:S1 family peptidase n=1 Tax=Streptomyces sp. TRM 70351 TaxID=3116552 RepID=UPI002E7BE46D|nr:S1 family peptidase [Streptomyces sp. TRM 70351]MEE1926944.1 S1 family peptidase [Streptomyces sp. TRM 70351]